MRDSATRQLTQRQKAAVVVHLLISGGVDPGVGDLPREQQRQLVCDMAGLRFVDKETLAAVVSEFAAELDNIGLHVPRDPAKILVALDGMLSLDVVEALATELGLDGVPGAGPWEQVAGLDAEAVVKMLDGETDEVCAILLSKLPASRAADLMKLLPPERASAVSAAFARTESVAPDAVAQIGVALGQQFASRPAMAFATDGVKRVAAILNSATASVRRGILESLDQENADFAARVRASVFSFENIPDRIDPRDMPRVLRNIDNVTLVTALAGLSPEQAHIGEFILGAISKRMAEQIREEMAERGTIPTEEVEEAMGRAVAAIREMEDAGELTLNAPPDG
ncbi:flagellar motor switch protein FliG [Jannaschia pohangensis]|uniref:Flagellar motor switch protein FliG n=2 Tax=Jannaschia pohangensis TaxID=390807 RepID=A0A1I3SQ14_9RHOB|nr:flagellar motor switch protein FliG [Jannaschia pohangensis]